MKRINEWQRKWFQDAVNKFQEMIDKNEELCRNPEITISWKENEWEKFNEEYKQAMSDVAHIAAILYAENKKFDD